MPKRNKNWNYEATVAEIEAILEQIEFGSLPLEEVFAKFAIAVEHLQACEAFLNRGKQQMNLLIENLAEEIDF